MPLVSVICEGLELSDGRPVVLTPEEGETADAFMARATKKYGERIRQGNVGDGDKMIRFTFAWKGKL